MTSLLARAIKRTCSSPRESTIPPLCDLTKISIAETTSTLSRTGPIQLTRRRWQHRSTREPRGPVLVASIRTISYALAGVNDVEDQRSSSSAARAVWPGYQTPTDRRTYP